MNIMQMVSGVEVSGAAVHCGLLARELARRGHHVTLVCRPGAWIQRVVAGEPVAVVESDLDRWPPSELRRMTAIARERGIEVVHTHMSRAHSFGILLRWSAGVPCVATAHNQNIQLHWMLNDAVIAVSEATRRYHRRRNFVRRHRIETIHNFIDAAAIAAVDADAGGATRARFGIDPDAPLIGAIGTVIPRKGLVHLVRALPRVLAAMQNARLLVVGDQPGRHAADLRHMAAALGVGTSIVWAGRVSGSATILAALDVLVLASIEEPFGLVAGEAMAAGLAVVATAVDGVPECVSDNQTGVLVPPADSTALADAIIALLRDPERRRQLGAAGRRRVREHFAPETQVPRIEAVLARAAARAY